MAHAKATPNLQALPTSPSPAQSLSSEAVLDALKMILIGAPLNDVLSSVALLIEAHTKIYNGYWFFGRPTIEELRQDLRAVLKKCRPNWDITRPELKAAWEHGEHERFYAYGKTYGQVFREQE